MAVTRITCDRLSESEKFGLRAAGYIQLQDTPDPDTATNVSGMMRVVDVGDDWIDVARD